MANFKIKRSDSTLPPNREFWGRFNSKNDCEVSLVHLAPAGVAKNICAAAAIEPRRCQHFCKDLIYFFVELAAYIPANADDPSYDLNIYPVAFVMDMGSLPTKYKAHPFDSGAALTGKYDSQAFEHTFLDDYEIDPTEHSIGNLISWAFGDKENYWRGKQEIDLESTIPDYQSATLSYLSIARIGSTTIGGTDRRANAIEVSTVERVPLSSIKYFIAPHNLLTDKGHENEAIEKCRLLNGFEIKSYDWNPASTPRTHHARIQEIIELLLGVVK